MGSKTQALTSPPKSTQEYLLALSIHQYFTILLVNEIHQMLNFLYHSDYLASY